MSRVIAKSTLKKFMKKYSFPLMVKQDGKYKYKTMAEMEKEIFLHEMEYPEIVGTLHHSQYGHYTMQQMSEVIYLHEM